MIPTDLSSLANHLWQSTLFAAGAQLLTLTLRKNRAAVRYWIWLAASVKFLIPFSVLVSIGSQLEWRSVPATTQPQLTNAINEIAQPFFTSAHVSTVTATQPSSSHILMILIGAWLCGFILGLIFWVRALRQIRAVARAATAVHLNLPIPVMFSPERLEPGVFGILKPVLILPAGIADRLTPAQFEAVLAHELCHVRRRDNLTAAIQMAVEVIFWFHPLVWWIRTQLVKERERACDEEVIRGTDPQIYAEAILDVCKLYLESPPACVSGITGSDLKARIRGIMTHRIADRLHFGKKALLAAAGVVAVGAPVFIGMTAAPRVKAQSTAAQLAFDVASVKPIAGTDARGPGMEILPGGRVKITNYPLYELIESSYDVPYQSPRMSGGPEWIHTERYDIDAKPPDGAVPAGLSAKDRNTRIRLMLQSLLANRFKLVVHHETKEIPVYSLVVGKNGPRLKKAKAEEKDCKEDTSFDGVPCHQLNGGMGRGLHGKAVSMSDTVEFVEHWADRPVIDNTRLKGLFEIDTDGWTAMRQMQPRDTPAGGGDEGLSDPLRSTLFTIFEGLGLRLESAKAPVEVFMIEHVERPSAN